MHLEDLIQSAVSHCVPAQRPDTRVYCKALLEEMWGFSSSAVTAQVRPFSLNQMPFLGGSWENRKIIKSVHYAEETVRTEE